VKRPNLPAHHLIAQHWIAQPAQRFVYDLGEPSCFACGWWSQAAPVYPDVSIIKAWRQSRLERAHLTPHALGGGAEVDNLVLLCHTCHTEAPDWRDATIMLSWMEQRQSWLQRRRNSLNREWAAQAPNKSAAYLASMSADELREKLAQALSENGNTHGQLLSDATIVAALLSLDNQKDFR
jgi:hypothetical protein